MNSHMSTLRFAGALALCVGLAALLSACAYGNHRRAKSLAVENGETATSSTAANKPDSYGAGVERVYPPAEANPAENANPATNTNANPQDDVISRAAMAQAELDAKMAHPDTPAPAPAPHVLPRNTGAPSDSVNSAPPAPAPAAPLRTLTKQDLVDMAASGVGESAMLSLINASRIEMELTSQSIIDLHRAGLTDEVIQAVVRKIQAQEADAESR